MKRHVSGKTVPLESKAVQYNGEKLELDYRDQSLSIWTRHRSVETFLDQYGHQFSSFKMGTISTFLPGWWYMLEISVEDNAWHTVNDMCVGSYHLVWPLWLLSWLICWALRTMCQSCLLPAIIPFHHASQSQRPRAKAIMVFTNSPLLLSPLDTSLQVISFPPPLNS